jgi:hypothetical protein
MSQQSTVGPSSCKRPDFGSYLDPGEHLMETEATAAGNEKNNQKKMKNSDSDEVQLAVDSEKSKVKLPNLSCQNSPAYVLLTTVTVSLCICPSICPSVGPSLRLSVCLSVCLSVPLSPCPSASLSICLYVPWPLISLSQIYSLLL